MYKTIQVVMLPTNEKANLYIAGNILYHYDNGIEREPLNCNNQHLHFLSDETPKEGDWIYDSEKNDIIKRSAYHDINGYIKKFCKKIICTTDSSFKQVINDVELGRDFIIPTLPQPPQDFINYYVEQYNQGNVIKWVDVEYEEDYLEWKHGDKEKLSECLKLKVNSKNEITIRKIKDSYSREEVITLLEAYGEYLWSENADGKGWVDNFDKWISENL